MGDCIPVDWITCEEARRRWPLRRRPGDDNQTIWIDEAADITPETMRLLAAWPYRNVLNRKDEANG